MRSVSVILQRALSVACAAILGALLLVVFGQVVMRYVLHLSFVWGEELARFLQIWLTFLGATLAFVSGGHASIQMLVERFNEKGQKVVRVLAAACMAAFFLVLAAKGIKLVRFAWSNESPALSLPYGMVYLAFPVASGLICLLQLRDLVNLLQGKREPLLQRPSDLVDRGVL
jgi:TRAP-type transport system small permease protein